MLYKEKNDRGRIRYGENIIGSVARHVIADTDGRALPSDAKGRHLRGDGASGASDDAIIDAVFVDGALNARIYILVRFGSSIQRVCADIDRDFREQAARVTGTEVGEFTVAVKGLLSKNVSRRDIEVTTHAGDQPKPGN